MMPEVYRITNNKTNQVYIGVTSKTSAYRFAIHVRDSKASSYTYRKKLFSSMRKYGVEHFRVECLCMVDLIEHAFEIEKFLIKEFQLNICRYPSGNGLNMTDGGDGNHGYVFDEKTKTKMSQSAKLKYANGFQHPRKGKKMIPEQLAVHLAASPRGECNHRYGKDGFWKGKVRSEESKKKTSESVRYKIQKKTLVYAVIWEDGRKDLIFGLTEYSDKLGIPSGRMKNYAQKGISCPLGFRVYKMLG